MIPDREGSSTKSTDKIMNFTIDNRVECSGHFGTIKYIGEVDGHSAVWLGIDWDDAERGKHNGTVNGKHYFTASFPKSGSFVRPEKVHLGQSAIRSITSRYGKQHDDYANKINQQNLLSVQQTINAPFLQLVGFDKIANKQSDFNNLKVVNLRMQNICNFGKPMEFKDLCPNVVELDISKNLIHSWTTVFEVCQQLHFLEWLNVSENNLALPNDCSKYHIPHLKTLICGSMRLVWKDIITLSTVFPNMEELRAISNNITNLSTPIDNNFKNLKLLDLENNKIREWSEICKLSVIPSLEHLVFEFMEIKCIKFEKCENQQLPFFRNVKRIALSNNLIDNWESIAELNKLQNLEDLRFIRNPILETETYATCNQIIVAMIANLRILNAAEISQTDRRAAEYDYQKKFGLEWLSVKGTKKESDFLERHNRYLELVQKYGDLEEDELIVQPNIIKSSLVNVVIQYGEKVITKKLPKSIIIQKLIMLIQRLLKLNDRPKLTYVSGSKDIEIELDDECKELGCYSIEDGDRIIVHT